MSLITGAGRSGLDPVGKWSLILAPILFIVGGFMTADFGSYHTGLVGDIAANGTTAGTTEALKKISVSLQYLSVGALLPAREEGLIPA